MKSSAAGRNNWGSSGLHTLFFAIKSTWAVQQTMTRLTDSYGQDGVFLQGVWRQEPEAAEPGNQNSQSTRRGTVILPQGRHAADPYRATRRYLNLKKYKRMTWERQTGACRTPMNVELEQKNPQTEVSGTGKTPAWEVDARTRPQQENFPPCGLRVRIGGNSA